MSILHYSNLTAWQEASSLTIKIYKISEKFPAKEQFGITNQIRRAAVSITSNIAEGFGRSSPKDKRHFYVIARGSLYETESQAIIGSKLGFISQDQLTSIRKQTNLVARLLSGLIRSMSSKP